MTKKSGMAFAAAIAFCFAVLPPLQAVLLSGEKAVVTFLASDAFYYLSVAANSSFGNYTFDGLNKTNGFHPLWQVLLQAVVCHLATQHGAAPMYASFALSLLGVGLGSALVGAGLFRIAGRIAVVFLLFPGLFYLLTCSVDPRIGSLWSFANGMESALSIFFFGLLFLYLTANPVPDTRIKALTLSLISMGILFSRLDDVFLLVACGGWILLGARGETGSRERYIRLGVYAVPLVIVLSAYLLFNMRTVGVALPTSGLTKASGLALGKNTAWLLVDAVPSLVPLARKFLPSSTSLSGLGVAWRLAQILIPFAVACAFLWRRAMLTRLVGVYRPVFVMLLSYVVLKAAYNFTFVPIANQGHWYFPISILITNGLLSIGLIRIAESVTMQSLNWRAINFVLVLVSVASAAAMAWRDADTSYQHTGAIHMLENGPRVAQELRDRLGAYRLIEFDDGILNYSLQKPTLSGFGLAADAKSANALKRGIFLQYASQNGYSLLGSANYMLDADVAQSDSTQLRNSLQRWPFLKREKDLDKFRFTTAFVDPVTKAYFIQFVPK